MTAERELTDAECDAIAKRMPWKGVTYNHWLIRAGWQARAGIAPPREPTEAMRMAGLAACNRTHLARMVSTAREIDRVWQAMYDAAPIAQPRPPTGELIDLAEKAERFGSIRRAISAAPIAQPARDLTTLAWELRNIADGYPNHDPLYKDLWRIANAIAQP